MPNIASLRRDVLQIVTMRLRQNGGIIRTDELRRVAFVNLIKNSLGLDMSREEAGRHADEIVNYIKLNFSLSKYRPSPKRTAAQRGSDHLTVLRYALDNPNFSLREIATHFDIGKTTVGRILQQFGSQNANNEDPRSDWPYLAHVLDLFVPRDGKRLVFAETLEKRLYSDRFSQIGLDGAIAELQDNPCGFHLTPYEPWDPTLFIAHRGRVRAGTALQSWAAGVEAKRKQQLDPDRASQLRYAPLTLVASASSSLIARLACAVLGVARDIEDISIWITVFDALAFDEDSASEIQYNSTEVRNRIAGAFRQRDKFGLDAISSIKHFSDKNTEAIHDRGTSVVSMLQRVDERRPDLALRLFAKEAFLPMRLDKAQLNDYEQIVLWASDYINFTDPMVALGQPNFMDVMQRTLSVSDAQPHDSWPTIEYKPSVPPDAVSDMNEDLFGNDHEEGFGFSDFDQEPYHDAIPTSFDDGGSDPELLIAEPNFGNLVDEHGFIHQPEED